MIGQVDADNTLMRHCSPFRPGQGIFPGVASCWSDSEFLPVREKCPGLACRHHTVAEKMNKAAYENGQSGENQSWST